MNLIFKAMKFAEKAHRGQTRKYNTDIPYFIHPLRVMYRLRDSNFYNENMLCAALLHDTVEDCEVKIEELNIQFSRRISELVSELTQADKENPNLKVLYRNVRHQHNLKKLRDISSEAKIIKVADRLDNLSDIDLSNNECYGFLKRRYLQESWDIYKVVRGNANTLDWELEKTILDLAGRLNVELQNG